MFPHSFWLQQAPAQGHISHGFCLDVLGFDQILCKLFVVGSAIADSLEVGGGDSAFAQFMPLGTADLLTGLFLICCRQLYINFLT